MVEVEYDRWRRGHATPESIAWAIDLSDGERVAALMTLAHLGWSTEEQAKFAAIWLVIADRRNIALALAGACPRGAPWQDLDVAADLLGDVMREPLSDLIAELEREVTRFRRGEPFTDAETERLGALWAVLNIHHGVGSFEESILDATR
jgi:hypothetical protein